MKKQDLRQVWVFVAIGVITAFLSACAGTRAPEKTEIPTYENDLKIALINFQPVWGDKAANLEKMKAMISEAADNGAELILFPEMALTGYAMEQGDSIKRLDRMQVKLAEPEQGSSAQAIAELTKEKGVYVVYGYPEVIGSDPLNVYNAALVAGPEGIVGSYEKIHPFGSEVIWCKTGKTPFVFMTPWGPIGISICYDTYNYPELGRFYGAAGCRLILNPTATSRSYFAKKDLLTDGTPKNDGKPFDGSNAQWVNRFKSRTEAVVIQSDLFVASANLVGAETAADGTYMGTCFPGGSSLVGPTDDKKGTDSYMGYYGTDPSTAIDEQIIYSDIDLTKATRKAFNNYIDTDMQEGYLYQPSLYAEWFKNLADGKFVMGEK